LLLASLPKVVFGIRDLGTLSMEGSVLLLGSLQRYSNAWQREERTHQHRAGGKQGNGSPPSPIPHGAAPQRAWISHKDDTALLGPRLLTQGCFKKGVGRRCYGCSTISLLNPALPSLCPQAGIAQAPELSVLRQDHSPRPQNPSKQEPVPSSKSSQLLLLKTLSPNN